MQATIKPGDLLIAIDGQPYQKRVDELSPEIAASTSQSMSNRVAQLLLNGDANSSVTVTLASADGKPYDAKIVRSQRFRAMLNPYRNGEIFRLLTPKIGYVDLERLGGVDAMFRVRRHRRLSWICAVPASGVEHRAASVRSPRRWRHNSVATSAPRQR
jgi:C-terminal processing protease CtpA/Prc